MRFVDIIQKKRDGEILSQEEISFFIEGYTKGSIPDYQVSSLLMAVFFRGMNEVETAQLTLAIAESGDTIDLQGIKGVKVDKHSTGGVGDKTTLILAPLVAAVGVKVAKMSGRGLGHTGGTIDKLEAISGFRTTLTEAAFVDQVNRIGLAVIGQTGNLTPADKKLYALRDVTATVNSIPLIASSVMSKKLAAGADVICLDVKVGDGAFMKTVTDGKKLATEMVEIGRQLGKKTIAFLTNMDEPLGNKVGNALEIEETIATLHGHGPADLTELCLEMGSQMVVQAGIAPSHDKARQMLQEVIQNGKAFETFCSFITAQGGDIQQVLNPQLLPRAQYKDAVLATETGYVSKIHAESVGVSAMMLGAGRATKDDAIDPAVGIELCVKVGQPVTKGQPLAYIYHNGIGMESAHAHVHAAYEIQAERVEPNPLIFAIID